MAGRGRKQPERRAVAAPMLSQQLEDGVGKRDLAVPAALAADAEDAASTVDIGNLEVGALHEAQATAVDRGQADAVAVVRTASRMRQTSSRLRTTGSVFSRCGLATSSSSTRRRVPCRRRIGGRQRDRERAAGDASYRRSGAGGRGGVGPLRGYQGTGDNGGPTERRRGRSPRSYVGAYPRSFMSSIMCWRSGVILLSFPKGSQEMMRHRCPR